MTFPWPSCWLYTSLGLGVWVFGLRRKAILLRHEYEANREELNRKMNARNHEVLLLKSEAFSHQEKLIPLQKSLEAKTMELASTERKLAETNARLSRILELYPDAEEKAAEVTRKKAEQKAAIAEAKRIQALRQKKVLAVLNEMKGGG